MSPGESILILLILKSQLEKVLGYAKLTIWFHREEAGLLLGLFKLRAFAELVIHLIGRFTAFYEKLDPELLPWF